MNILVCVKRVPDTSDNEIILNADAHDIERDDLVYSVNEPDNYAVEEALRVVERVGGEVTVVTVGGEEDEEVLRREMAMGAKHATLLSDPAFQGSDGRGIATILKHFIQKNSYDLILTGVQADDGAAQVGGMLAAMLDYPFASLVNGIEPTGNGMLRISREIEGGCREVNEISLPCVLSIQTGINEPRYVGMRGIKQVAGVTIPTLGMGALALTPASVGTTAASVQRVDYFVPEETRAADILQGTSQEVADQLLELLKSKGGLQ